MRHFQGSAWVLVHFWRGNCYWRSCLSRSLCVCVCVCVLKNWSKADLQYCVSFRHIAKWFSYTDMFCIFPAKSCRDAQRSGSPLVRDQVNMVNEAKVPSPVHSTLECWLWDLQSGVVGKDGPSLWTSAGCRSCSFWCISSICWTDVMVSLRSESCSRSDGQQTTEQWPWPFLGATLALGSALELLSSITELVVVYNPLFIAHHNPVEKWFIVV